MNKNSEDSVSADINRSLKDILEELRGQKSEINALKDEVKGNAACFSSVKKLKTEKDNRWKFEDYCLELIKEAREKLRIRNKRLRIADRSEAGWDTVRQYEPYPLASDSDDESRINRAESRALKNRQTSKPWSSAVYDYSDSANAATFFGSHSTGNTSLQRYTQPIGGRYGSFRGYSYFLVVKGTQLSGEIVHLPRVINQNTGD
ncbi:hypothetical protein ACF0H5_003313 [Mactra antiquata]